MKSAGARGTRSCIRSSFSKDHVEGKVRNGGPLVSVRVSSGNITIE